MNEKDTTQFNYGVYARKSSESEDRQVQSIERQVDDFLDLQKRENLNFHDDIIKESKSAFSIGREGFNELVKLTDKGKVNAWLCWHASRLSRNPIDTGIIIHLLDTGKLHHIRTPSRVYFNTPTDKMMLQIEFTMSKKDSDDKSVFVKSGLKKRYKKGFPCGKAPIGYLNDKTKERGDRDWLVDKERFQKLKLLFIRFLKGNDSISTITDYARETLQLTTPKSKVVGGKYLGRSMIEHVLKNPIYAGFFYSKNEHGNGRKLRQLHKAIPRIISKEEHMRILNILGSRNHPNNQSHLTPYTGFIKGLDDGFVGADVKLQVICDCKKKFAYRNKEHCPSCGIKIADMKKPTYLSYTYYYNIKRKRTKGLSVKSIEEQKINNTLLQFFEEELQISDEFCAWAKLHLKELKDAELENDKNHVEIHENRIRELKRKKARLRELFLEEVITKDEYQNDLAKFDKEIETKKLIKNYAENWYEHLESLLDTLLNFDEIVKKGDYSEKRMAFELLCPNLVWNEENLLIHKPNWLKVFIKGRNQVLSKYPMFEPKNHVDFKSSNDVFDIRCPILLGLLDKVRKIACK